jgi:tetratricopeptide (TPR) repeat protein
MDSPRPRAPHLPAHPRPAPPSPPPAVDATGSRGRTRGRRIRAVACSLLLVAGAEAALAAARARQPGPPRAPSPAEVIAQARERLTAGDAEGALELVAPLLAAAPDLAPALLVRSEARLILGELAEGRRDLERSLALDPGQRQGWLNLAAIEIAERRYEPALEAMRRARDLDPGAPENELNIGAVELLAGRLPEASRSFSAYLARNPASADAAYLVATNYALAGYAGLAAQHLQQAIAQDERSRIRARNDPNFEAILGAPQIATLLVTDAYVPPPGAYYMEKSFSTRFAPPDGGPLLLAVLDAIQLSGEAYDPRVEITPGWALVWGTLRIKVTNRGEQGVVELSAPPSAMKPELWERRSQDLLQRITTALAVRLARTGR